MSLRTLRKAQGYTQAVLAEKLNVTWQAIANYESGARKPKPSIAEKSPTFPTGPSKQFGKCKPHPSWMGLYVFERTIRGYINADWKNQRIYS